MPRHSELYEMLYLIGASSIALNTIRAQILKKGADKVLDSMIGILEREDDNVVLEGITTTLTSSIRGIMEGIATSEEYLQELRTPQCLLEIMPDGSDKLVDPADRLVLIALMNPSRNQRLLRAAVKKYSLLSIEDGFHSVLLTLTLNVISVAGICVGYIDEFEQWAVRISHELREEAELMDVVRDILNVIDKERSDPVSKNLQI